ncbi:hypothetical protein TeGR_g10219 [Tetraparma gracilis]|uniref:Transcription factor Iwr1 domain-containing protein n=1 Tax=Tetraparma gracilis TaxID=2962635 RepID=A0ABQ6M8R7_9STRA|nr:hypothetical protein TeGR_g10219 [Tetraparma gracilis]
MSRAVLPAASSDTPRPRRTLVVRRRLATQSSVSAVTVEADHAPGHGAGSPHPKGKKRSLHSALEGMSVATGSVAASSAATSSAEANSVVESKGYPSETASAAASSLLSSLPSPPPPPSSPSPFPVGGASPNPTKRFRLSASIPLSRASLVSATLALPPRPPSQAGGRRAREEDEDQEKAILETLLAKHEELTRPVKRRREDLALLSSFSSLSPLPFLSLPSSPAYPGSHNHRCRHGTVLHVCVLANDVASLRSLLAKHGPIPGGEREHPLDLRALDAEGRTASGAAELLGYAEVWELLAEAVVGSAGGGGEMVYDVFEVDEGEGEEGGLDDSMGGGARAPLDIPLNVRVEGVIDPETGELVLDYEGGADEFEADSLGSGGGESDDSNREGAEGNDYPDEEDLTEDEDSDAGPAPRMQGGRDLRAQLGGGGPKYGEDEYGGYGSSDDDDHVGAYEREEWRGMGDNSGEAYNDGWGEGFAYDQEEDDE